MRSRLLNPIREAWRRTYRQLRIARREAMKAAQDASLYGSGFVMIYPDGHCKHLPAQDVIVLRTPAGRGYR